MKKLLYAALIGLNAMSCTDRTAREVYTPQLPPITQTGANTFGAIINGKVMIPRNSIGYQPPGPNTHYAAKYTETTNYYEFGASNARHNVGIYFYLKRKEYNTSLPLGNYPFLEGIYYYDPMNQDLPAVMMEVFINDNKVLKTYLSISNTGSITISRNDSNVISGTFSCKLKNKDNPEDIIEVKDGRFDFNKQTINTTNFP
ncbi:hypothetical protein CG08_0727 [Riemerella anatipestifer]|nr:hypothetical protein CG08_0727 [Riemerella anatipestifer]